ncbi:cytochrome oxidase small assembly protein [Pigmentiphaga aceris]|nr:cytochrome oxidase small assembly protein [Pigmentiphaga aceris]
MLSDEQRRRNRRTGLILGLLAASFFLAVFIKRTWF